MPTLTTPFKLVPTSPVRSPVTIRVAQPADRDAIYRMRHAVYAAELGQHPCNEQQSLSDSLDEFNQYLVAVDGARLLGFVSITPPTRDQYSLDKYLPRADWPFLAGSDLYEIRILTVTESCRSSFIGPLLMYAAFRQVEQQGGRRLLAIGRSEVVSLYLKTGMRRQGHIFQAGAVQYELLAGEIAQMYESLQVYAGHLRTLKPKFQWELDTPWQLPEIEQPIKPLPVEPACYHGGAFFQAIGENFQNLNRRHEIINADVLDAWFPPAPAILDVLREHLEWLVRTSPPTNSEGLIEAISQVRKLPQESLVVGSGSSDLIFRALTAWLRPTSRVLLLDPTYGEYQHLLHNVIGCHVERFRLSAIENYQLDLDSLRIALREEYDLVILVNPNNPTGQHVPREQLELVLREAPRATRFWIDEAYLEYVGQQQSLEQFAAASENVVVCKSLSKGYALSGVRAGYLSGPPALMQSLRLITPPWPVSLPGQLAAVTALRSPDYYQARYAETRSLRATLAAKLESLGLRVFPGVANFVLCGLATGHADAATVVRRCQAEGVFLRDVASMTQFPDGRTIRIAVKDEPTLDRLLAVLQRHLER